MANPEHLATLTKGVTAWNARRRTRPKTYPDLAEANLIGANLRGANLSRTDLDRAVLTRADLEKVDRSDANLGGSQISEARLVGAILLRANLRKAKLSRAKFGNADLGNADFTYANLSDTDMRRVHLRGAVLLGADLRHSNLSETDLYREDLSNADLTGANLSDAFLSDAVLSHSDLRHADLSRAYLRNVNLTDASIGYTVFGDNDLSMVIGLETVQHKGPSVVGIDTIFRSQGNIPETFLRGAGVPEDFITYMRALVGRPVEFYSCFISYSTKDQGFADRLYSDLQGRGVRCWFAPHDLQGGKKLHEQIDDAIRHYDKLLLILSSHSMNSEWVKTEIAKARRREVQEKRRILFPLRLVAFEVLRGWECFDADTGKDSAREIREYFIPDFGGWKDHDSFQEAFDRLLLDLKLPTWKANWLIKQNLGQMKGGAMLRSLFQSLNRNPRAARQTSIMSIWR